MSSILPLPLRFGNPYRSTLTSRVLGWHAVAVAHCAALLWLWYLPEHPMPQLLTPRLTVTFVAEQTPVVVQHPEPVQLSPPKPAPKMIATPNPASTAAMAASPEEVRDEPVVEDSPAPPASAEPPPASDENSVVPPDFRAAYLNNPGPQYPNASRRRREEGVVTLKVLVSAAGAPEQVLIDASSGYLELDNAASSIVKERWRFVPAKQRNLAVPAWVIVPMSFELKKR